MKNTISLLLFITVLFACKEDETLFDASISRENIRFKAIPGGAVMYSPCPLSPIFLLFRQNIMILKGRK